MPKLKLWHEVRRGEAVGSQVVRLQDALARKEHYASKLEALLRLRTKRIAELANTVAVLRDQNRRLSEEADHLAELFKG